MVHNLMLLEGSWGRFRNGPVCRRAVAPCRATAPHSPAAPPRPAPRAHDVTRRVPNRTAHCAAARFTTRGYWRDHVGGQIPNGQSKPSMLTSSQPDAIGGIVGPKSEWAIETFDVSSSQLNATGGTLGPQSEWTIEALDVE
jgi:hypothetical protein